MNQQITVLIVDDDEGIRNLLKRILEDAGFGIDFAIDGEEAIEKFNANEFSIVLLDIYMPGMSGIEVLDWINEKKPNVCVVMVTAMADIQTAVEAMKKGAFDYITKPFSQEDVLTKIKLAYSRKQKNLREQKRIISLEKKIMDQTSQLLQQFAELVDTLAREQTLLYKVSENQSRMADSIQNRLFPEIINPASSTDEINQAVLNMLKRKHLQNRENTDT